MKVGDHLECVSWMGENYTAGRLYLIQQNSEGALIIINNKGRPRGAVSTLAWKDCFRLVEHIDKMAEPDFDLDDMELAEILIEEMKSDANP